MTDDKTTIVSISHSLSEWQRLIDLIDISAECVNNKVLSSKLREVAGNMLGKVAPLGAFRRNEDEA